MSHRRYNPLTREWVLVSPHRTDRPWQGQTEPVASAQLPAYDPACYLCPGNERANGARNPAYGGTFAFDNDFAALTMQADAAEFPREPFVRAAVETGICRVLCFSPRHDLTLARMSRAEVRAVVESWALEYERLGADPSIGWVQIFENRGEMMGASNPHPHAQIWAESSLPNEAVKELHGQSDYAREHGSCLLCDYVAFEVHDGVRLVYHNDTFAVVVPFWAIWPFETLVLPRFHTGDLRALDNAARDGLADAIGNLTARYDRLFNTAFPYSMGFHQRPTDGKAYERWHLHAHYYPPLLRSATVRKFMVGYEMLSQPQRDFTAESAAARLREV
jgi:UDPglucose--hexose-1-phosphate uridylyltransferase